MILAFGLPSAIGPRNVRVLRVSFRKRRWPTWLGTRSKRHIAGRPVRQAPQTHVRLGLILQHALVRRESHPHAPTVRVNSTLLFQATPIVCEVWTEDEVITY